MIWGLLSLVAGGAVLAWAVVEAVKEGPGCSVGPPGLKAALHVVQWLGSSLLLTVGIVLVWGLAYSLGALVFLAVAVSVMLIVNVAIRFAHLF
jgi:hypothetical protein